MPIQRKFNNSTEFAAASLGWLAKEGQEMLAGNFSYITGSGSGAVYSIDHTRDPLTFRGYEIDVLQIATNDDIRDFQAIGFTPEQQAIGMWVLHSNSLQARTEGLVDVRPDDTTHVFASYSDSQWTVARRIPDTPGTPWRAMWETSSLSSEEKSAIGKIGVHTAFLRNAANTLKDDTKAYDRFKSELEALSQGSGQETNIQAVYDRWGRVLNRKTVSRLWHTAARLPDIAPLLYRTVTGKSEYVFLDNTVIRNELFRGGSSLERLDDRGEFPPTVPAFCPPFEENS